MLMLENLAGYTGLPGTISWAHSLWITILNELQEPACLYPILTWAITFTLVMVILLGLGFGPAGIAAGSTAASFQAWMYGGFTPAAGIFAKMTSLAMLGYAVPAATAVAMIVATVMALLACIFGIGT